MSRFLILLGVLSSLAMSACGTYQEIVFRDDKVNKTGNKVVCADEGVVGDTLRIELMKQGKFDLVDGSKGYDFNIRINSLLYAYTPNTALLSGQYSVSVTSKTGEIVFIRVMNAGDMKSALPLTLAEIAQLVL